MADSPKHGLDDPRALEILATEHWSLLSTRTLGYQEMIGRTTIFVAILSARVVALAVLATPRYFGPAFFWFALLLLSVAVAIGIATFCRGVTINFEDALWITGMNLLRKAYVEIAGGRRCDHRCCHRRRRLDRFRHAARLVCGALSPAPSTSRRLTIHACVELLQPQTPVHALKSRGCEVFHEIGVGAEARVDAVVLDDVGFRR